MVQIENKANCCGCNACVQRCPKKCITMQQDTEGFFYPDIREEECVNCGLCERVCPVLHADNKNETPKAYAMINTDATVREESSSGGVFTLIALYVLERRGVVFGAALTEGQQVKHICVEKEDDLSKLRGSKYVQSEMGNCFAEAEYYLQKGRLVLFTGTPCQIGGLKAYLRKGYDNLITQDIVCHGVPSPMVWKKYVDFREEKAKSVTRKVYFRNKRYGWKEYALGFEFENATKYMQKLSKDLYMRGFLADLCLRPSCYQCAFKSVERISDITLADYWGVAGVHPEMDDDKGTSLVFVHSKKGKEIFENILPQCIWCATDMEQAIARNPAMIRSPQRPFNREMFISDVSKKGFDCVKKKYFRRTAKEVMQVARRILSRMKHMIVPASARR